MQIQKSREPQIARYDLTTIWLHWATVALIIVLWVIGQTADWAPRGPFRTACGLSMWYLELPRGSCF